VRSWKALKHEVSLTFTKEVLSIIKIAIIAFMAMGLCVLLFSFSLRTSGVAFIAVYGILMTRWYRIEIRD